jgi:mono/diheme cytochrome c family protein
MGVFLSRIVHYPRHGRPYARDAGQRLLPQVLLILALLTAPAANVRAADQAADPALVERGRYVATLGDCAACHTSHGGKPFAGGESLQTPFGAILATNVTPSKTNGIGSYTLAQFTDAVRRGVRADGAHLYPAMPYTAYTLMSDDDIKALYAYFMNAVEPVDTPSPRTLLPFPFNIRALMGAWNLLFLDDRRFTPDPQHDQAWNRGAYLVRGLTHCGVCHTARNVLMGEQTSKALGGADLGTWRAPNITSDLNSGIGGWSTQDLISYLHTGRAGDKAQAAGPMAEAVDYSLSHVNDGDLAAIASYLKTVSAVHEQGDPRPPFAWGQATSYVGQVRGTAPPADPDATSGPLLYDAHCATCHNDRGQGTRDGSSPPLFHNTALGRPHADNMVMTVLSGVTRGTGSDNVVMPGFAGDLSDRQVATLANWLTETFGNPDAKVTADQVSRLRSGQTASSLLAVTRALTIAVPVLVVVIVLALLLLGWRRRREASV